jgi:hypothetical protein
VYGGVEVNPYIFQAEKWSKRTLRRKMEVKTKAE